MITRKGLQGTRVAFALKSGTITVAFTLFFTFCSGGGFEGTPSLSFADIKQRIKGLGCDGGDLTWRDSTGLQITLHNTITVQTAFDA